MVMGQLVIDKISKSFNSKKILSNVSLKVEAGDTVCLLGKSGCGKTTLFNIISGLTQPDSGKILLNEKDITCEPGHLGYMQQKDLLLPHKTVIENVALPLIISGMGKIEAFKKADAFFKDFEMNGLQDLYPGEISGGQRQRASLLRTYLLHREFYLLDEPFSALDVLTRKKMQQWFKKISKDFKISSIFITHDIDEAVMLADKIYIMSDSKGQMHCIKKSEEDLCSLDLLNFRERIVNMYSN